MKYLTLEKVAELYGIEKGTVAKATKNGELRATPVGRNKVYSVESIDKWIESKTKGEQRERKVT